MSLGVAGVALYIAKQVMSKKRKIELDEYRACEFASASLRIAVRDAVLRVHRIGRVTQIAPCSCYRDGTHPFKHRPKFRTRIIPQVPRNHDSVLLLLSTHFNICL